MKTLIIFWIWLLINLQLSAQSPEWKLLGEGSKNSVKLLWQPTQWPEGLKGFQVKRRSIDNGIASEWKLLNKSTIIPENTYEKNLSNVSNDKELVQKLLSKRNNLIQSNGLKAISSSEYLKNLKNEGFLKILGFMFSMDYDRALISGFGYVDVNIPPAESYEYGLFLVYGGKISGEPVQNYNWKYGQINMIDLAMNSSIKKIGNKVAVKWKYDPVEFKDKQVNGFNLYQRNEDASWSKVNKQIIRTSGQLDFYEHKFPIERNQTKRYFGLVPVSIFNTEGKRSEITVDTELMIPEDIETPRLNFKKTGLKDIEFTWEFNASYNPYVLGFILERKEGLNSQYKSVSELISPEKRQYADTLHKELDHKYYYRLVVRFDDRNDLWSNKAIVYFPYDPKPPSPINFRGKFQNYGDKKIVLSWERAQNDSITQGYYLKSNFPPDTILMKEGSIPLITGNQYEYEINRRLAAEYFFQLIPVSKKKTIGDPSEVISVKIPSEYVPRVMIKSVVLNEDKAVISWKYREDIHDLKGFRILQNGEIITSENELNQSSRLFETSHLLPGNYWFEVVAVTEYGLLSEKSIPKRISI